MLRAASAMLLLPALEKGVPVGCAGDELYARTARRHGWLLTAGKEESA